MTTTATCPACGNPQADGLLDDACTTRLERDLGDVPSIVHDLDVAISKQARIGAAGKGGPARERSPINFGAVQVADDLTNTLTTWARDVGFVAWPGPGRVSAAASRYLLTEVPAIRRHPAAAALVDEISDAIRQARRVVDRPADRVYLGQCLFEEDGPDGQVTCYEELFASPTASSVVCKVCGVTHDVAERRAWLLKRAEDMLFTVKEAAQMVGDIGHITVTESSIRGYIHRQRLAYRPGTKTLRLGDLLAVVVDEGERRTA